MSLIKYRDPFDSVFSSWINYDKFDNWYDGHELGKTKYRWNEDDKTYTLESVMPGLTKKDVSVTFKADTLTIKCNKSVSEKDREFYGVKSERSFSNFPQSIDADSIEAEMTDGVLRVILHKKEPDSGKSIEIK
jgi:HSP20 family protein